MRNRRSATVCGCAPLLLARCEPPGARAAPHLVDLRVVDDLVGDVHALVGERVARLVRHAHRALDAPAVAVGLGELDGHVALHPEVALLAHLRDEAGAGVADAVLLHELVALGVLAGLAHVAARLVQRAAHRAAIDLVCARHRGKGGGRHGPQRAISAVFHPSAAPSSACSAACSGQRSTRTAPARRPGSPKGSPPATVAFTRVVLTRGRR